MRARTLAIFLAGLVIGAAVLPNFWILSMATEPTKVHRLKVPLALVSSQPTKNLHLLPAGTTLYFEQSFAEGFTRYRVYINVDRMPLKLEDLSDPTEVDPLEARRLHQAEWRGNCTF